MANNNNEIISLGDWSSIYNCLYWDPALPSSCRVITGDPGDSCYDWRTSWSAGSTYEICSVYSDVPTLDEAIGNLWSYTPNPSSIAVYYRDAPTPAPTSVPTASTDDPTANPTLSPSINSTNCEDLGYIKHINWNNLLDEGGDEIPNINYDISVSAQDMTLTIIVELDYLGYSYINNVYGFGTRYHLGFYSFHSDSIIDVSMFACLFCSKVQK